MISELEKSDSVQISTPPLKNMFYNPLKKSKMEIS